MLDQRDIPRRCKCRFWHPHVHVHVLHAQVDVQATHPRGDGCRWNRRSRLAPRTGRHGNHGGSRRTVDRCTTNARIQRDGRRRVRCHHVSHGTSMLGNRRWNESTDGSNACARRPQRLVHVEDGNGPTSNKSENQSVNRADRDVPLATLASLRTMVTTTR